MNNIEDCKKKKKKKKMSELLTRDAFREGVFKRDSYKCVICKEKALDAHHIIERRLWGNGGYYLDNGASLCEKHHLEAESTVLSCDDIRFACGIENIITPEHLYHDNKYDKWGNIILENGYRTKGELFFDESVQKIMSPVLHLFVDYIKYPRTYHLPFSNCITEDDRVLRDCSQFNGKRVVITEKMDGENTTIYKDYIHARSLKRLESHPSRNWVKNLQSQVGWELPEGWRLCGENLFSKHSIFYNNLKSYLYLFSIWNNQNICLPWKETCEYADILGLTTVPVLYDGIWDEEFVKNELVSKLDIDKQEGFVVRLYDEYPYSKFRTSIAKYVRINHNMLTNHNWKNKPVIENQLQQKK